MAGEKNYNWWIPWYGNYWEEGVWYDNWQPGIDITRRRTEWVPEWYKTATEEERRSAAQKFRQDLGANDARAWQEYTAYIANALLPFMNPESAKSFIDALQITGGEGFSSLYGDYVPQLGIESTGQILTPGLRADQYFQQASRWDAILEGFTAANDYLIGRNLTDKTEFTKDAVLDPYESMRNWFFSLAELGKKYGLSEDRQRLNRWQQQEYYRELENLMSLAPNEQIAQLGYALIEQPKYTVPESPVQTNYGRYNALPQVGGFNSPYSYRNAFYV